MIVVLDKNLNCVSRISWFVFCLVFVGLGSVSAKDEQPTGLLAASIGENVILFDPVSSMSTTITTGPVGWLFPAPSGIVFAPDLVHGKTTVINLRQRRSVDVIDGVTMPHFGDFKDRYYSIGESVMLMSYPERALLGRVDVTIENPWQVVVPTDGSVVLVFCRRPDIEGGARLVAVDMRSAKLSYNSPIPGDITRMEFIKKLSLVAMTDRARHIVHFVAPGSLALVASLPVGGVPVDLVAYEEGRRLAVACSAAEGGQAVLRLWKIKSKKETIEISKEHIVPLPVDPVGLAMSPSERWVAVALIDGQILVIDIKKREVITTIAGPNEAARDFIWVDPATDGPILEQWSDTKGIPAELELETWTDNS